MDNNSGLSDFDRPHRFSASFVYHIPTFGSGSRFLSGFEVSGFLQLQSGNPFTVFASEPEIGTATTAQYNDLARGSGGLYRLGFGRPNFVCSSFSDAILGFDRNGVDAVIDRNCFASPQGGFGNLGRNTFRGPSQRRFDIGIVKRTKISETTSFEIGLDVFNLFNTANFATPNVDLQDATDFGRITNTVGGPRLAQIRARFNF